MIQLLQENKNYRLFFSGHILSALGDRIDDIAFIVILYGLTQSTFLTSIVFIFKLLFSFTAIITATFIDRFDRKKALVITSYFQAIVLLVICGLYISGNLNITIMVGFSIVQALFSTVTAPAKNAILAHVLPKADIMTGRTGISVMMNTIQIIGYALAGVVIGASGVVICLILDSMTFLIAGYFYGRIEQQEILIKPSKMTTFKADVQAGFQFVAKKEILVYILGITIIGNFLIAPLDAYSGLYFSQLNAVIGFSLFMTIMAVSSVGAGLILSKVQKYWSYRQTYVFGFAIGAIGFLLLSSTTMLAYLSGICFGISNVFVSVSNATLIQVHTPKELIGRVFSIFSSVGNLIAPLSLVVVGIIGQVIPLAIIFGSLGLLMGSLSLITSLALKRAEHTKETDEDSNRTVGTSASAG
ncbi:MAG: MFS transporter [Culicoidibacterales bacterium]